VATITIRKLDDAVKQRLRLRAARHGRSLEEEAREILRVAVANDTPQQPNLAESIRRHINPLGGVDLKIPARQPVRRLPRFAR